MWFLRNITSVRVHSTYQSQTNQKYLPMSYRDANKHVMSKYSSPEKVYIREESYLYMHIISFPYCFQSSWTSLYQHSTSIMSTTTRLHKLDGEVPIDVHREYDYNLMNTLTRLLLPCPILLLSLRQCICIVSRNTYIMDCDEKRAGMRAGRLQWGGRSMNVEFL